MKENKTEKISIYVTPTEKTRLQKLATEIEGNISQAARLLIKTGLDCRNISTVEKNT